MVIVRSYGGRTINDFIARHCVMQGQACDSAEDNDNRVLVYRLTLPDAAAR
ncbi:hypothetical protein [Xanthomonas massiliensis]|uniref:hypothetical protein n=1 Tax=Xanthomonas massiliensis TaxID=1720302 RepID=UPI001365B8F5|nr:hypothetical protein [Xanthomonas massiliensis]